MKKQFIADFRASMPIDTEFLVLEKELRAYQKDASKQFLQVKLGDKTGSIRLKVFDSPAEAAKLFEAGDYVSIRGNVQQYRENLEMVVMPGDIKRLAPTLVDQKDFVRTTTKDVDAMLAEMKREAENFENPHLKKLLLSFFTDEKFMADFKRAPAAKIHHHTYVGGLLEHTHGVFTFAKCFASVFAGLDRELLLTGAILHDIGKIKDYEIKDNVEITDFGGLVGHIIAGDELLKQKISQQPDFPEELALRMRHMLLSHHNKGEWGSPVEPRFKEAIALHYADLADSHIAQAVSVEEEETRKERTGSWSGFVRDLDRMLYLGKK